MITGDHKVTAAAIAKRIGILKDESEACEGAEIDNLSDEELKDFVEHVSVYARVSPEHKNPYCARMAGKRKYRIYDR